MHNGVERVHLIDCQKTGGLLLELYTRDGVGTMLSQRSYDEPRPARASDINGIMALIKPLEAKGMLTKRSKAQIELDINHFSVIERDGLIIGCAALYPIKNSDSAELSCLAIHENYRASNRGIQIVEYIVDSAKSSDLKHLFVLTTQSIDWFKERGFAEVLVDRLPPSRRDSYSIKRNSKVLLLNISG